MKILFILISLIFSFSIAFSNPTIKELYASLKKIEETPSETTYKFIFRDINGRPDSLDPKYLSSFNNLLDNFEEESIIINNSPHKMSVIKKEDLTIAIKFTFTKDKGAAMFSCLQDWYINLPSIDKKSVIADLNSYNEEAISNLLKYKIDYVSFFKKNIETCPSKYEGTVTSRELINPDIAIFLFTGFSRWYNNNLNATYRNFQYLLKNSKEEFNQTPKTSEIKDYLEKWLKNTENKISQRPSWENIQEILKKNQIPNNRTHLTLAFIKNLFTPEEINEFLIENQESINFLSKINTIDDIVTSCYPQKEYKCKDYKNNFISITFSSSLIDNYSTFLIKEL